MIGKLIGGLRSAIPAPWVIYVAIAMSLGSAFAGWTVRGWQCDAGKLEAVSEARDTERDMADVIDDKAVTYETEREQTNVARETRTNTIREIYRDVPVPADCAPHPAALRVLQDGVAAANAATSGQSGGELPAASGTP